MKRRPRSHSGHRRRTKMRKMKRRSRSHSGDRRRKKMRKMKRRSRSHSGDRRGTKMRKMKRRLRPRSHSWYRRGTTMITRNSISRSRSHRWDRRRTKMKRKSRSRPHNPNKSSIYHNKTKNHVCRLGYINATFSGRVLRRYRCRLMCKLSILNVVSELSVPSNTVN